MTNRSSVESQEGWILMLRLNLARVRIEYYLCPSHAHIPSLSCLMWESMLDIGDARAHTMLFIGLNLWFRHVAYKQMKQLVLVPASACAIFASIILKQSNEKKRTTNSFCLYFCSGKIVEWRIFSSRLNMPKYTGRVEIIYRIYSKQVT